MMSNENEFDFEEVELKPDIETFITEEEAELNIRLNNPVEIEDALNGVLQLDKKVEWLKQLKKYRAAQIDEKIRSYESKTSILKDMIQTCMEEHEEKTLDFPGMARLTVKKNPVKWEILDEEKLFELLKEKEIFDEVVKMIPKIIAKEQNKFLKTCSDEELEGIAEKIEGIMNLSVTKHKPKVEKKSEKKAEKKEEAVESEGDINF